MVSLGEGDNTRAHSLSPVHRKPVARAPLFRSPQPNDSRKKKVSRADVDELRQSMHQINQRVEKKGGIFGLFRKRKDSNASDDRSSKKSLTSPGATKGPMSPSPSMRRGRRLDPHEDARRRPRSLSPEEKQRRSPGEPPLTVQPSHKKKVFGREMADELRESMHVINMRMDAKNKKKQNDPSPSSPLQSPKASKPLMQKLGLDLLMSPKGKKFGSGKKLMSPRGTNSGKAASRPSIRPELADELKKSVHQRKEKKASRRKQIMDRILMRRKDKEGDSSELSGVDDESSGSGFANDTTSQDFHRGPMPSLRKDVAEELRMSFHHRGEEKEARRREIKERIQKNREGKAKSKRTSDRTDRRKTANNKKVNFNPSGRSASSAASSTDSFASEPIKKQPYKKINLKGQLRGLRGSQHSKDLAKSDHSADTFMASFSDEEESTTNFLDWKKHETNSQSDEVTSSDESFPEIPDGDFDAYKREWARLIRKKKSMKRDLLNSKKKLSLLSSEVNAVKGENKDLKKQLKQKTEKISRLSSVQAKDRTTFDNSTDLIAKARVDLAKALNEQRALRSKIDDMDEAIAEKDARMKSLSEMIELQSDKIDDMVVRLRDCDTELRYNLEEKRKIEDELAVVVAAQNGDDLGDVFRMLEEERENWLDDRERELEERRIALDEENEDLIERERVRYQRESDDLVRASQKQRAREEEQKRISKKIEKQLSALKKENRSLQERLSSENLEMTVELKDKEHNIAVLEQQVAKLKKKIASAEKSEKVKALKNGEIDSLKDDLKDAQKHNRVLEKQIKKMDKEMEDLRYQANNWQEVILPGHRGITFGDTNSETLAGFLTILVAEESRKHKRKEKKRGRSKSRTRSKSRDKKKKKDRRDRKRSKSKDRKKDKKHRKSKRTSEDRKKKKKRESRHRSSSKKKKERDKKEKSRGHKKISRKSSRHDNISNKATKEPRHTKSRSRDRTPSAILLQ